MLLPRAPDVACYISVRLEVAHHLPPASAWWRDFATRYVTTLCAVPEGAVITAPDDQVLDALVADAPPMAGAEYMTTEVLTALWTDLDEALREQLAASKRSLQEFLKTLHPVWNLVGRVHFNLAGKPQRRGGAVRFSRHLHRPACRRTARRNICPCRRRWLSSPTARAGRGCSRC